MSWTRSKETFVAFKAAADGDQGISQPTQIFIEVWEMGTGECNPPPSMLEGE